MTRNVPFLTTRPSVGGESGADIVRMLSRLRLVNAALLIAVLLELAVGDRSAPVLAAFAAPALIVLTYLLARRLQGQDGPAAWPRLSAVLVGLDMVATLSVLAVSGYESGDPESLIIVLPLVQAAAIYGLGLMTMAWLASSMVVLGWSLANWDGEAQPITAPGTILVLIWMVAAVAGFAAAILVRRASLFETAQRALDTRTQVLTDLVDTSMSLSAGTAIPEDSLIEGAIKISGGTAAVHRRNDPQINRELLSRARQRNGAAIVGKDDDGACHIAISLHETADHYLIVRTDHRLDRFSLDALEILCLQNRSLTGPSKTQRSEPQKPELKKRESKRREPQKPEPQKPEVQKPEVQKPEVQKPELHEPEPQNASVQRDDAEEDRRINAVETPNRRRTSESPSTLAAALDVRALDTSPLESELLAADLLEPDHVAPDVLELDDPAQADPDSVEDQSDAPSMEEIFGSDGDQLAEMLLGWP